MRSKRPVTFTRAILLRVARLARAGSFPESAAALHTGAVAQLVPASPRAGDATILRRSRCEIKARESSGANLRPRRSPHRRAAAEALKKNAGPTGASRDGEKASCRPVAGPETGARDQVPSSPRHRGSPDRVGRDRQPGAGGPQSRCRSRSGASGCPGAASDRLPHGRSARALERRAASRWRHPPLRRWRRAGRRSCCSTTVSGAGPSGRSGTIRSMAMLHCRDCGRESLDARWAPLCPVCYESLHHEQRRRQLRPPALEGPTWSDALQLQARFDEAVGPELP